MRWWVIAATAAVSVGQAAAQERELTIFAAASLSDVLGEIAADWQVATGQRLVVAFAGSAALARQIEQGAPADLFVSADRAWMDYLAERGLIRAETRVDLLGNRLVLIAPSGEAASVEIGPELDLPALLGDGRLAMADVAAVPAGRYGRAALEALGLWAEVEHRLAQTENVRGALALVARGEAPLGIVYATDAAVEPAVEALGTFPLASHPPIAYPAAVTAEADAAAGPEAFLDHLRGGAAGAVFERFGFALD
jgi:molybdate transport system substrate-binding protein